jgi:peptidoglycan/xylan/chitin deacetylase (PgdA/CDA1 family)
VATFLSVDLDDIDCYHQIHGLPAPKERGLALRLWLPRFLELFEAAESRATFFVIGKDLDADIQAEGSGSLRLKDALAAGHELGNHSYEHAYDMVDWDAEVIARDLARCDALLRGLGAKVSGFRAPGYTHNRKLLMQVAALGYRYDSSRLPSPSYYLAKRGVMAVMKMRGQSSSSYRGGARSFVGETYPHFMSELGLWEVPMSVSRVARLPLIGTFLLGGAPRGLGPMLFAEALRRRDLVLELHAFDLADAEADGIDERIVAKHPELRVPLADRIKALKGLLEARGGGQTIMGGLPR